MSAGATCRLTKVFSVKLRSPPCLVSSKFLLMPLRAGVRVIWSVACSSRAVVSKNASRKIKTSTSVACRTWSISIKVCVCRRICRAFTWTSRTCVWNQLSACSTSASPPTPCRAGRWRSRSVTWRTTVKSTPSPATASGPAPVPISSRPR